MKQIKNILYIIKVIAVLAALLFISTAIVQLGMIATARRMGIVLKEELLYDISGSLSTEITTGDKREKSNNICGNVGIDSL